MFLTLIYIRGQWCRVEGQRGQLSSGARLRGRKISEKCILRASSQFETPVVVRLGHILPDN